MFAKERVARFLKSGGPDAVLAEIDRLDDSSYVRRVYYTELLKQAPPTDALLGRVLQRVPNELTSDYDKSTLLTLAAQQPAMNDTHRVAIARAVKIDLERLRSTARADGDPHHQAAGPGGGGRGARSDRLDRLELRSIAGAGARSPRTAA